MHVLYALMYDIAHAGNCMYAHAHIRNICAFCTRVCTACDII